MINWKTVIIIVLIIAVLAACAVLLYKHFVLNSIMDKDGMINPFLYQEETASAEEETVKPQAVSSREMKQYLP